MRKNQVVEAAFDFFKPHACTEVRTEFADVLYVQDAIAVGVLFAPIVIAVATAAMHHENGGRKAESFLDSDVPVVDGANLAEVNRKATGEFIFMVVTFVLCH